MHLDPAAASADAHATLRAATGALSPQGLGLGILAGDFNVVSLGEGRFDFTPAGMIEQLGLRTPCFRNTTNHGHFGRPGLAWERPHQPF